MVHLKFERLLVIKFNLILIAEVAFFRMDDGCSQAVKCLLQVHRNMSTSLQELYVIHFETEHF